MPQLIDLQDRLHKWRRANFPGADHAQQFEGMVEELGELAKARLKRKQRIRGTIQQHEEREQDALGDLLIYALGYASYRGWNLGLVLEKTADQVMKRDWARYPHDGLTK